MARRDWFQSNPYLDEYMGMGEDLALWACSMHHSVFTNVPEPLYYYREFATHRFRKYQLTKLAAIRLNRTVDRQHFPMGVCMAAEFLNWARIGIYGLAALSGTDSALITARSRPVDEQTRRSYLDALARVRRTAVPGLSNS
jgi:hypothetical protein